MKKTSLVKGALILTMANLITRVLGFVYRIYMSNVIGAEGMGLYQLIMPIYMLAWSISSSGFSTTISKLTAQENAKREYGNIRRILKHSVIISSSIGIVLSILLYFYADYMALHIVKDARTFVPLKVLTLAFPFMAAGSCIRGYFFGTQNSMVPAISQVVEQSVRMLAIYLLSATLIPKGLTYACTAAVIGIGAGEIISFLVVAIAYKKGKGPSQSKKKATMGIIKVYQSIFTMAIPLTANRVTGSLLAAAENILIPQMLLIYGMTNSAAMGLYGELTGMAMPLVQFPSAFLMALSITLVPAVSEATTMKNLSRINHTVSKSLLFTAVIGIGASILFIIFPDEVSRLIYKNADISEFLFKLGFMCPLIYLQIILSGMLNGLGEQVFIFRNSIISSAITISFIYFLMPVYGIDAFIMGWCISLVVVSSMSIVKIIQKTKIPADFTNWILKPFSAACFTGCLAFAFKTFFPYSLSTNLGFLSIVCVMYLIYFLYLILTKCILKEDIQIITNVFK